MEPLTWEVHFCKCVAAAEDGEDVAVAAAVTGTGVAEGEALDGVVVAIDEDAACVAVGEFGVEFGIDFDGNTGEVERVVVAADA